VLWLLPAFTASADVLCCQQAQVLYGLHLWGASLLLKLTSRILHKLLASLQVLCA
jgi:hypothetical protein